MTFASASQFHVNGQCHVDCLQLYLVLIFPTVHLTVHYELVDVEPATHGEGAQAAEGQTRDDKVAIKMGPSIPLCCDHLDTDTVVDMDQSQSNKK